MTDTKALDALIEAVVAGEEYIERILNIAFGGYRKSEVSRMVMGAYHGSLDASKALHKALLPGWGWSIQENGEQTVWPPNDIADEAWCADGVTAFIDGYPARAWLLAVLKAYRASL